MLHALAALDETQVPYKTPAAAAHASKSNATEVLSEHLTKMH